jgi:excisionase family DNA binding protein
MAGVRGEKLLTASDLAALCEVDLKTIHNWVDRGRIAHFRTPGRHLRFRAADVAEFLRAWGYTVPRDLVKATTRSVLAVGSKETASHVIRSVNNALPIRDVRHPYDALILAGVEPTDVYVLDARVIAEDVDLPAMLEALHRGLPAAKLIVLSDESLSLPGFVSVVGSSDTAALRAMLMPEAEGEVGPAAAPEEPPRGMTAGGSSR